MPRKQESRKDAKILIESLFKKAASAEKKDADEYVRKARRLAMRHKVQLGLLKRRFCKHCYSYLRPGLNCRVRTKEGKVVYYCSACRNYMRFPMN
ncbi:MAG TPA: ribonuclease P [Candidatus Nanoarchaeia archaeon]|nr:ribonuclease P [Candidatus Nanoarchaeia archaeon]